jgi:hypothetical protein
MSSQALPKTVEMLTENVTQRDATIKALRLTIEKLKIELTHLKRMRLRPLQREDGRRPNPTGTAECGTGAADAAGYTP